MPLGNMYKKWSLSSNWTDWNKTLIITRVVGQVCALHCWLAIQYGCIENKTCS
jgi:hypothetical protein